MILTMAYLVLIASLLGLAAHIGERICGTLGWPRRGVWLAALAASLALPALMFLENSTTATPVLSLPPLLDQIPVIVGDIGASGAGSSETAASPFSWPDWRAFDSTLTMIWAVSSAMLLLAYLLVVSRLHRSMRFAQSVRIGEQTVLLSDRFGPAVLGFFKTRIVLPRWLAENDTVLRTQVLRHEREHIASRDQLVLLAGLLLLASMPWNLAVWWQLRRLRAAIELDCDSRVLCAGADPHEYSQALLSVSQRARHTPFAAVALTEPMSELERRIRTMLDSARTYSFAGLAARSVVIVTLLGIACAFNAPNAQQATDAPSTRLAQLPGLRLALQDQIGRAQSCLQPQTPKLPPDIDCARRAETEAWALPDLNAHELAQLHILSAYINFQVDDMAGAIADYEAIAGLPIDQMPDGLVSAAYRNLASLYAEQDRYQDALDIYDRWLALPFIATTVSPPDLYFRAQILYVLEDYSTALTETKRAIASEVNPPKVWYELLLTLQTMVGDPAEAIETRAILDTRWPNSEGTGADRSPVASAPVDAEQAGGGLPFSGYLPLVKPPPVYPPAAAQEGIEGYVLVQYTVTTTGETKDIFVVESSASKFERAAIESVRRYRYQPRMVDDTPIEVPGVQTRITFVLED